MRYEHNDNDAIKLLKQHITAFRNALATILHLCVTFCVLLTSSRT